MTATDADWDLDALATAVEETLEEHVDEILEDLPRPASGDEAPPQPDAPVRLDLIQRALHETDPKEVSRLIAEMTGAEKRALNAAMDGTLVTASERAEQRRRALHADCLRREGGPVLLSPEELSGLALTPRDPLFMLSNSGATVFAERDYGMIFAARGTGKTMFTLSMGLALAAGARFCHLKAVMPRRVLVVEGEMPLTDMKERIASLLRAFTEEERALANQNFRLLSWESHEDGLPSLAGPDGWTFLDRALEAWKPDLVILDNISCLAGAAVENDEAEWKSVGDWAKAHRRTLSLIWVHHSSRGGTARGTSKREDPMDFILHLRQPRGYEARDGACFELVWTKARGRTGAAVETRTFKLDNDETDLGRICRWNEVSAEDTTSKAIDLKNTRLEPIAKAVLKETPNISKRAFRAECRELYKEQFSGEGIGQAAIDRAWDWLTGYGSDND